MKKIWLLLALLPAMNQLWAQAPDKGLTLEVYEKAKTTSGLTLLPAGYLLVFDKCHCAKTGR